MNFSKEFENTKEIIKRVFESWKYKTICLTSTLIIFGVLYYFFVAKVADNDIWISVMMSGETFVTFSIINIFITSTLSGVLISMIVFKINSFHQLEGKGMIGLIGGGIAAFGVGCPTCGAFLFGLIGLPLALMYFPFRGLELQVFGILILILSIYFTVKSIRGVCEIK